MIVIRRWYCCVILTIPDFEISNIYLHAVDPCIGHEAFKCVHSVCIIRVLQNFVEIASLNFLFCNAYTCFNMDQSTFHIASLHDQVSPGFFNLLCLKVRKQRYYGLSIFLLEYSLAYLLISLFPHVVFFI